ncbi:hypothetical protein [Haliangium sp.]|uniref:hypothetical protein n=1 Tax=Haliangium sp. TaxID=2663208 RepID=UPI003D0C48AA
MTETIQTHAMSQKETTKQPALGAGAAAALGMNDKQFALVAAQMQRLGGLIPKQLQPRRLRALLGTVFMVLTMVANLSLSLTTIMYMQPLRAFSGEDDSLSVAGVLGLDNPDAGVPGVPSRLPGRAPSKPTQDGAPREQSASAEQPEQPEQPVAVAAPEASECPTTDPTKLDIEFGHSPSGELLVYLRGADGNTVVLRGSQSGDAREDKKRRRRRSRSSRSRHDDDTSAESQATNPPA